jgi:hypothetical protein
MFVLARGGQTYARPRFGVALAVASGKLWHDGRITAPAAQQAMALLWGSRL